MVIGTLMSSGVATTARTQGSSCGQLLAAPFCSVDLISVEGAWPCESVRIREVLSVDDLVTTRERMSHITRHTTQADTGCHDSGCRDSGVLPD